MADDWTEKYRPKTLIEIVGNPGAAEQIRKWAEKWAQGNPSPRALTLIGTPGIGKTSAAEALAKDMGWDIVEMNASDQRNADAIKNIALRASQYNTFDDEGNFLSHTDGRLKLIVLDEADCLYGNSDRGAMPVIAELIKTARQPVILIANDGYGLNRKSSVIKDQTLQITFRRPTAASITKVVRNVAKSEGVEIEEDAAIRIADNASGDIRAALRDLQSLASGKTLVTADMANALSGREARSEMFDVVGAVYRRRDPELARKLYSQADTDPETLALWLSDNMPYECSNSGDLVRVSERLARADVYIGRVKKRMLYGFRSYAVDLMLQGIPESIRRSEPPRDRLRFPTYLMRMSRSKGSRALRASTASKLAAAMHTSSSRIINDVLPQLRFMLQNDAEMRRYYAHDIGLEPEELAFVLGVAVDKKIVKDAYAEPKPEKAPKTTSRKKKAIDVPSSEPQQGTSAPEKTKPASEAPVLEPRPVVVEPARPSEPASCAEVPKAVEAAATSSEPAKADQAVAFEEPPSEITKEESKPRKQRSLFDFGA